MDDAIFALKVEVETFAEDGTLTDVLVNAGSGEVVGHEVKGGGDFFGNPR